MAVSASDTEAELTANERAALEEILFGLSGPHTLDAIAARLGRSRERVRRLEQRALAKMARAARRAGLEEWAKD